MQEVQHTTHISFDSNYKTFSIYSDESLYAFAISPELTLEHIYWGKKLPKGYDLRYVSQSARVTPFNTTELWKRDESNNGISKALYADTLDELQDTWRQCRALKSRSGSPQDIHRNETSSIQQKRLENACWRVMSMRMSGSPGEDGLTWVDEELVPPEISLESDSDEPNGCETGNDGNSDSFSSTRPSRSNSFFQQSSSIQSRQGRSRSGSGSALGGSPRALNLESNNFTPCQSPSRGGWVDGQRQQPVRMHRTNSFKPNTTVTDASNYRTFDRKSGIIGKGELCVEYSDFGTGDFRSPSFTVTCANGSAISPLRYRSHKIYRGKLPLPYPLPGIRSHSVSDSSTLVVTMADNHTGLEVDLIYVALHSYNAITRRVVFRNNIQASTAASGENTGSLSPSSSMVILRANSMTIDFESTVSPFHVVQLSGSWARERQVVETKLTHGMLSFGSGRGVSSHQHNPFVALTIGPPSETHGETKGVALVYSGNFLVEAELSEMGRLRINMGINPHGFQWHLEPASEFHTPETVLARSGEGLGGLSRVFHRLFSDRLLPSTWADHVPPVILNSWEAKYFAVSHENIVDMARQARAIGVDLLVLDDGWFGCRDDDKTSLGDWVCNELKFPFGMAALAKEVNALGMRFGIWFEPEMVSEQSRLYRDHPDWCLDVPGRPRQVGRNQLVLDLSRQDVRDHIFSMLDSVLCEANIEYMKWDMNRPLTEVFSKRRDTGAVWQAETSHRYVLGLYELQHRLTQKFPHVLLENCASGGGRFDAGMLFFSPQIWTSDNTDAMMRLKIQFGTSLAYPARCISAHVSAIPNHITGNSTRARTRAFVSMCGTFGFEVDLADLSVSEILLLKEMSCLYREIAPTVRYGDLYRLWSPFKSSFAAWMYVSRDKAIAVVFAFSVNSDHWSCLVPRLLLQGLAPEAEYEVSERLPNNLTQNSGNLRIVETEVPVYQLGFPSMVVTGETLMQAGLPIKFYTLDDSVLFVLRKLQRRQGPGNAQALYAPRKTIASPTISR